MPRLFLCVRVLIEKVKRMKFVDEVEIHVEAGKGGNGSLSFRREKCVPRGGPDGGNGGSGGGVFLKADAGVNTLVDFRYKRIHKAESGQGGMGRSRTGKQGEDLVIPVPIGTVITVVDTHEVIGDLLQDGQTACVAKGGHHGLGNECFKSSTNQSPRKITLGKPGEARDLRLELKLLADAGLLGLPNAGKSTFVSRISNATPKVADYPFTTLRPHLGVVKIEAGRSYIVADIPGLIEGAASGVGLGIQFLKHLARTEILLHLVDITEEDPRKAVETIVNELSQYDERLHDKERWLVVTKADLLLEDEAKARFDQLISDLNWQGEAYLISSSSGQGIDLLKTNLMRRIEEKRQAAAVTAVVDEESAE